VLVALSVISVGLMLERLVFFATHRMTDSGVLAVQLARGELDAARAALGNKQGLEAAVLREGFASMDKGADTVEQVIASTLSRERPRYERFLSVLGTLGNNAPFIGLFGTVLGVIKAFNDLGLGSSQGAAIQQTVMAGISEALVATGVGLGVAIPAVVAFNAYNRWLKTLTSRANALGFALVAHLRAKAGSPTDTRKAG
jgi:biopolymer transport protein ExbB